MTDKTVTVPEDLLTAFDQAVDKYPDSERRQVLGYPAAYLNGNLVCGLHEDSMVLRLSDRDREQFLQIKGARPFVTEDAAASEPAADEVEEDDADEETAADDDGDSDDGDDDEARAAKSKGRSRKGKQAAEDDMSQYVVPPPSVVNDEAELDRWLGKAFTFVSTLPDGPRRGRSNGNSRGNSISGNSGNNQNRRRNNNNRNHRKKTSKRSASGGRKKTTRKTGGRRNNRQNRQSGQAQ